MLKKISTLFRDIYTILHNILAMCCQYLDNILDRFRDESARIKRQIDSFLIEFQNLIPNSKQWDQIREDINIVLQFQLPQLVDRKKALLDSLTRVNAKLDELRGGFLSNGVIKNTTFALENKKLLEQKIKETDEHIHHAVEFLNNLEVMVIAFKDEPIPPPSLLEKSSEFIEHIQITSPEDTRVKDDITREIDGFKLERSRS